MARKSWRERFEEFDRKHPDVYEEFKRIAETARTRWRRFGGHAVIAILRWKRLTSNDTAHNAGYKINECFAAYYVRKLIADDPSFAGFFELRRLHEA